MYTCWTLQSLLFNVGVIEETMEVCTCPLQVGALQRRPGAAGRRPEAQSGAAEAEPKRRRD